MGSFSENVSGEVKSCYEAKLLRDNTLVLWCFGDHGDCIHRETLRCALQVRHYADDLAERIIARERARCSEEIHLKPKDSAVGVRLNLQPPRPHPDLEVSFPCFPSTAIMMPPTIANHSQGLNREAPPPHIGRLEAVFSVLKALPT